MNDTGTKKSPGRPEALKVAIALLTGLVLLASTWLLPGPFYESIDDVLFQNLLAGKLITNDSVPYLHYVNIALTSLIRAFYSNFGDLHWYALFHLGALAGSITFLTYLILDRHGLTTGLLAAGLLLFGFTNYFLSLQFTKTAYLLSTAGLLGFIHIGLHLQSRKKVILITICSTTWQGTF